MVRLLNFACPILVLLGRIAEKEWLCKLGLALSFINVGLGIGYLISLYGFCVI